MERASKMPSSYLFDQ
ncbi:hypothetical protein ACJEGY_20020 [Escherichia coli]|nr:hypothetical protein [Escherichia coli]UWF65524.1 hypothetical protein NZD79_18165 [Escherichia coli]